MGAPCPSQCCAWTDYSSFCGPGVTTRPPALTREETWRHNICIHVPPSQVTGFVTLENQLGSVINFHVFILKTWIIAFPSQSWKEGETRSWIQSSERRARHRRHVCAVFSLPQCSSAARSLFLARQLIQELFESIRSCPRARGSSTVLKELTVW